MREDLELDILTTARDMPAIAVDQLATRHPRGEVEDAIRELASDGFVQVREVSGSLDVSGLTRRGESLLHDLEHAD